jgi:hypothetical protein
LRRVWLKSLSAVSQEYLAIVTFRTRARDRRPFPLYALVVPLYLED